MRFFTLVTLAALVGLSTSQELFRFQQKRNLMGTSFHSLLLL